MLPLSVLLTVTLALAGPPAPAAGPPPPAAAAPPVVAPGAARPASSSEEFERGRTAFSRAEYQRAIGILQPLLYPEARLDTELEVVQAHRMLAVAHLFENHPDEARLELRKLLELRPDYRFDPLLDPPRVVEFFNQVLKDEENAIASMEAKRRKRDTELALRRQQEAERLCRERAPTRRYEKHSFAVSFLPFGAGQFQNGQRRKGWALLGAEAALGAVSVAAFSSNFILYGFTPRRRCLDAPSSDPTGTIHRCQNIDHSEEDLSRNLLRVQLVSGGLFFGVAILGVIDAIRNYQGEVALEPLPPTAAPGTSAQPLTPSLKKTSWRLAPSPFPLARGTGLGLRWDF